MMRFVLALSCVAGLAATALGQPAPRQDTTPPPAADALCKDAVDARHLKNDSGNNCAVLAIDVDQICTPRGD
jgi:hypothetical protein